MKHEKDNIGYAHDHLGAIEKGMPVFDNNDVEIGVVDGIDFVPHEENGHSEKSGSIKVRNPQKDEAYTVKGDQINYVNEGVVQLNVPLAGLEKI